MQTKTRLLLAGAVCASFVSPSKISTLAFTGGLRILPVQREPVSAPVRGNVPTSTTRSSSLLSSSNNNQVYFFQAPSSSSSTTQQQQEQQQHVEENYNTKTSGTTTTTRNNGMVSAEQRELESMEVATDDNSKNNDNDDSDPKEGGLPTSVSSSFRSSLRKSLRVSSSSSSSSSRTTQQAAAAAAPMDVDGNGTGALMNRSHTAGGPNAPLMVTSYKPKAYPIDSGKDGMDMQTMQTSLQQDGTRLVRYNFPPLLKPKQEPTPRTAKLVLASALAAAKNNDGKLAKVTKQPTALAVQKFEYEYYNGYNGPDVEDATDYDGMETTNSKMALAKQQQPKQRNRDRRLQPKKVNLVRYQSSFYNNNNNNKHGNCDDDHGDDNNYQSQQRQRRPQRGGARNSQSYSLANDPSYSNRYMGPTDFTLAKKTGLAVNKPISLWVERDKFL